MSDRTVVTRVTELVLPILTDLHLELYDLEFGGGVLKVTIDTPPGSPAGVDVDALSLASRLISRELDHVDPIPGHYTLEVSSPGLERPLRRPEHFRREVGKEVSVRLRNVTDGSRRLRGVLVAADDHSATVRVGDADQQISYGDIDRARTVFEWGPADKPGKGPKHPGGSRRPSTKESHAS